MRIVALVLAAAAATAVAQPARSSFVSTPSLLSLAPSPLLYVCNQNDASVTILDATTLKVVRTVDLKALGFSANAKPHHIVVEPDGSFWYVTLIGDNKIVKLDGNDRVVAQTTFETPGMMALHPAQDLLFVGRSMTAVNPPPRIGVVRRSDLKLEEIDVLFPRPHAMVIEPKSGTVYTASLAVNQIAAVDAQSERVELTQVEGAPHALMQFTISPDGNTLAVSAELSARVMLFDITERMKPRPLTVLSVERQPFDPMFSPDGRWIVLGNKAANAVTIIDARERKVAAVVRGNGLAQPHGIAISPDSRFAYVTNNNLKGTGEHAGHTMVGGSEGAPAAPAGPGTVVAIDLATQRIAQVIQVGHNASGIALSNSR
jgi:YVTN family beta-propeller protein